MKPPRWNGKTREELAAELLDIVSSTKAIYEGFAGQYKAAMALVEDIGFNQDGADKLHEMRDIHSKMQIARSRYSAALNRFNDLVVRGIPPAD